MDNAKVPALPCTHRPFESLRDRTSRARRRLRCEFRGPGDFGITVFFVLGVTELFALRAFAPLGALLARSVNLYYSDLEQTTRKPMRQMRLVGLPRSR